MQDLICFRTDRLTSRFQAMLASWRFARKVGVGTTVIWPPPREEYLPTDTPHYEISRIIDLPELYRTQSDIRFADGPIPDDLLAIWRANRDQLRTKGIVESIADFEMGGYYLNGAIRIYRAPDEPMPAVRAQMSALFRSLPIRSKLLALIEAGSSPDFTAVHVRRGDLVPYGREIVAAVLSGERTIARAKFRMLISKTVPIKAYETALAGRDGPFLVFSDDRASAEELLRRLGPGAGSVYTCDEPGLYPIERDLVTVIVMGRCREVLGGGSVFARFAAQTFEKPLTDLRSSLSWRDYVDMIWDECLDPEQDSELVEQEVRARALLAETVLEDPGLVAYAERIMR